MAIDGDFASRALAAKAIARRNRTVRNLVFLAGVMFGVAAASIWIAVVPEGSPEPQNRFAICVACGLAASAAALGFGTRIVFPVHACCPACGYDWEIKEGRHVHPHEQMPRWSRCPGCGAAMDDRTLKSGPDLPPA